MVSDVAVMELRRNVSEDKPIDLAALDYSAHSLAMFPHAI
jgi:hypothetical protein